MCYNNNFFLLNKITIEINKNAMERFLVKNLYINYTSQYCCQIRKMILNITTLLYKYEPINKKLVFNSKTIQNTFLKNTKFDKLLEIINKYKIKTIKKLIDFLYNIIYKKFYSKFPLNKIQKK